ncbi:MAG: Si-specific NAD(P)(+) transhydrogenase [Pseudomonadaceae bacterium]|nr:Si-specific NAD(P)(+) transhydrogenase [Pseudomonadaceae bacterium]
MRSVDVLVVGSGPAGQKAAIGAAKGGLDVVLCEQLRQIGGACVHHGTIPSKALRERAVRRARALDFHGTSLIDSGVSVMELIGEMAGVIRSHDAYMTAQLERNNVSIMHGRATFEGPNSMRVRHTDGTTSIVNARNIVLACGSTPRHPDNVPVDHENIYDSDSVLSLAYLPKSMTVLGGGVIASEYASIFALLGVEVTLIDRYPQPLGFLDSDLTERFVTGFTANGGRFIGDVSVDKVVFDGISSVETHLADGGIVKAEKLLCALGRVSKLDGLNIDKAGLAVSERGLVDVNENGQTMVPHIYAAGDIVGPPSLASASMEQGRRVALHLLGDSGGDSWEIIPSGIYSVPELSSVGMTSEEAERTYGQVFEGFAYFDEIARGNISDTKEGMLKLIVTADRQVRGIHISGEAATDLIHIGQMGLIYNSTIDTYIDNVFNFPTYAESYRVAALHAAARIASGESRSPMSAPSQGLSA